MASNKYDEFDPVTSALIDKICHYSDSKIVVSSTWRENRSRENICDILRYNGISRCYLHTDWATPVLHNSRQTEIDEWLTRHREITHWVVLDDGKGLNEDSPRLVQPNFDDGINLEHVLALLAILDGDAKTWFSDAEVKFTKSDTDKISKIQRRLKSV